MKKKNTGARDIFLFLLIVAVLVALASFLIDGAPVERTTYADVFVSLKQKMLKNS